MENVVGKKIKKNIKVVMGDPNLVEDGELFLGYDNGDNLILGTRMAGAPNLTALALIMKLGKDYFIGNLGEEIINETFGSGESGEGPGSSTPRLI